MACPGGYRGTPRTRLVPVLMYAICGLDQFLPELVGDSPTKFNHLQGENHWADLDGVKCGGLVWSPSTRWKCPGPGTAARGAPVGVPRSLKIRQKSEKCPRDMGPGPTCSPDRDLSVEVWHAPLNHFPHILNIFDHFWPFSLSPKIMPGWLHCRLHCTQGHGAWTNVFPGDSYGAPLPRELGPGPRSPRPRAPGPESPTNRGDSPGSPLADQECPNKPKQAYTSPRHARTSLRKPQACLDKSGQAPGHVSTCRNMPRSFKNSPKIREMSQRHGTGINVFP